MRGRGTGLRALPYRLRCTLLFLDGWDLRARSFGERRAPARSDHWAEILVMLSELYPGESLMNMSFRASSRKDLDP